MTKEILTQDGLKRRQTWNDWGRAVGITPRQFDQLWSFASILQQQVDATGKFAQSLQSHSVAFAATFDMDTDQVEKLIRDVFRHRYDQTPKQYLDELRANEAALTLGNHRLQKDINLAIDDHAAGLRNEIDTTGKYRADLNERIASLSLLALITDTRAEMLIAEKYREQNGLTPNQYLQQCRDENAPDPQYEPSERSPRSHPPHEHGKGDKGQESPLHTFEEVATIIASVDIPLLFQEGHTEDASDQLDQAIRNYAEGYSKAVLGMSYEETFAGIVNAFTEKYAMSPQDYAVSTQERRNTSDEVDHTEEDRRDQALVRAFDNVRDREQAKSNEEPDRDLPRDDNGHSL